VRRTIAAFALVAGLWITAPAQAAGELRLMFQSDWSGTSEVYAADPSGESPTAQATFGFVPSCGPSGCDFGDASFGDVVPSPSGRLILYTEWSCDSLHRASLFVARPDGTHPRALAQAACKTIPPGCNFCVPFFSGSWAPGSNRIAYAASGRIHIVALDGSHNHVVGRGDRVSWAPAGTSIAFSNQGSVSVRRNGHTRVVASGSNFWWSPNGHWLAYCTWSLAPAFNGYCGTAAIVRPDGSKRRAVLFSSADPPKWSGDSRFLSVWTPDGVTVLKIANGASYILRFSGVSDSAMVWQRKGHVLAVAGKDGTYRVDAATRASRLLTTDRASSVAAWSPDGSYLAYTTITNLISDYSLINLHVVTPTGESRTLINGAGPYGGDLGNLVWTRGPKNADYRPPPPRALAAVSDSGLTAPWTITHLVTDGDRVAYISCGHVFVWTPSAQTVVQAEPNSSLSPACAATGQADLFRRYTLALSGDRVANAWIAGGSGKTCSLDATRIADPASFFGELRGPDLPCALGTCSAAFGDLTGAGGLLVFSRWERPSTCPGAPSEQEILRLDYNNDGGGWSSALIATSPGPLVPFDVDAGRIVAGGDNATVLYDASGTQLLSISVSPLAAQLWGSDLVIVTRGQLLDYDARTGAKLHSWPLPDVPSGAECGSAYGGTWECRGTQLVLEDEAHGLAGYVLGGQLHLLRLADGADKVIGAASLARFIDAGLVYADGTRINFIPYSQLGG
jgi:hypothetical protein